MKVLHHTARISPDAEGCIELDLTLNGGSGSIYVGRDIDGRWSTGVFSSPCQWLSPEFYDDMANDEIRELSGLIDGDLRQSDLDAVSAAS